MAYKNANEEVKVSDSPRLQMVTLKGSNVAVCAVKGNFDDAQNAAKAIFESPSAGVEYPRLCLQGKRR